MKKQIILSLFFIILISSITSCACLPGTQGVQDAVAVKFPDIVSDNQGGAFTLYQVKNSLLQNKFYLQKINADCSTPWGERGILLGQASGEQWRDSLRVFTDNNNNALAIWSDDSSKITTVSKVTAQGNIIWQKYLENFMYSRLSTRDSSGGIVYVTNQLTLQKMNNEGELEWSMPLSNISSVLQIIDDCYGGVIVMGYQYNANNYYNLYIQKVDSRGKNPWLSNTLFLGTSAKAITGNIVPDGTGGCLIMWTASVGDESQTQYKFRLLRIDKGGNVLWKIEKSAKKEPTQLPASIFISGDSNGNNLIFWEDGNTMHGQIINLDGKFLWDVEKIIDGRFSGIISNTSENNESRVFLCNVVYEGMEQRYLKFDILSLNGKSFLSQSVNLNNAQNKSTVFTGHKVSDDNIVHVDVFRMRPDGEGGAIFAWGSSENFYTIEHSSVQKINCNGDLIWSQSGIRLDGWK